MRERGAKKQELASHIPNQTFTPTSACRTTAVYGAGFSAMPFSHTIHTGAGVEAPSCSLNYIVSPLPWDGVVVAFSKHMSAF